MTWRPCLYGDRRRCPYCGGRRATASSRRSLETCAEHRDLPALDPGPGDPAGFVPRRRTLYRDRGAVIRAINRAAGQV